MLRDANETWFEFTVDGSNNFAVYAFTGTEEVHKPYEFVIELVSRNSDENINGLIGKTACLTIADRSGETRPVHGVIRQMEQLHTANRFTHYRCYLVPRLWFLGQIVDHRIFQHKNVIDIIMQILTEQGFTGEMVESKLCYTYQLRDYCVQYGESDLHFISRLCEEEGIYFYFEHATNNHKLCFCDRETGPSIMGESKLRYYPGSGTVSDTAVISRLTLHERTNSNAATYREWNFTKPQLDQEVNKDEIAQNKAPVPPAMNLEQYHFPHLYEEPKKGGKPGTHGEQYVNVQLLRQITFARWIEGETDVSRLLPSYIFEVYDHVRDDINTNWWVVRTTHFAEQPQVLEHEAPERGMQYKAIFTAIPHLTRFVPELEHPKKRVDGVQSAIVTGSAGEEAYPDKYGRVKVQFHWDRKGSRDENSSCWVRASANWAGNNFGFIHIPRIGQEVLVEFMEGDPDRPIITGRVYYEKNMPPWQLPEQKHLSGLQSREFHAGRRNQLVMDDTKEEIQAQLSSDHHLSQLNLGYITRINHLEGRKDFRGEGFELRTDGWGVVRAAKGIYMTSHTRNKAAHHQKDFSEGVSGVTTAVQTHKDLGELSDKHKAHILSEDVTPVYTDLENLQKEIAGSGEMHSELEKPHMVFAAAGGMASTSVESYHIHSGAHTAITSEKNISFTAGKSFLGSFLEKICLFAHKSGIKIYAAMGKVQIQAQSDKMEILADKTVQIVSIKEKVEIAAKKEILLTAGGSFIRINKDGIEHGTAGEWISNAKKHIFEEGKTHNAPMLDLPISGYTKDVKLTFADVKGRPLKNDQIRFTSGGEIVLLEKTNGKGEILLENINVNSLSMTQSKRQLKNDAE